MPIVLSQAEKEMENNEIWIDTICFSHALAHPAKKVFWIQTVLAINAFPSNRDPPLELVWVASSLNMS